MMPASPPSEAPITAGFCYRDQIRGKVAKLIGSIFGPLAVAMTTHVDGYRPESGLYQIVGHAFPGISRLAPAMCEQDWHRPGIATDVRS
jgi:hypothetical protein